jgi:hypothetical protein
MFLEIAAVLLPLERITVLLHMDTIGDELGDLAIQSITLLAQPLPFALLIHVAARGSTARCDRPLTEQLNAA